MPCDIAFFGSSLVSAYWNGAATYYRGLIRALAARGHRVTFYEPDAYERQQHRDIADPSWARVVVYANDRTAVAAALAQAADAEVIIKASGVGVFDEWLEENVLELRGPRSAGNPGANPRASAGRDPGKRAGGRPRGTSGARRGGKRGGRRVIFWDVDAPATLDRVNGRPDDPFRALIPEYDAVFTYGGGEPVVRAYQALGASRCVPIYNAVDPATHFRAPPDERFAGTLGLLANRLPDREARVDEFFLRAAEALPDRRLVLGGAGWNDKRLPGNVRYVGHVYTPEHNAFNSSPLAVLNVNRDSMARYGHSPATRIFEAAGAAACLITDPFEGVDEFLAPGRELLVAEDGVDVARLLSTLTPERAQAIGAAARARVLAQHTYDHRAREVERVLAEIGAGDAAPLAAGGAG
jgi:spore maturation protein CgeB